MASSGTKQNIARQRAASSSFDNEIAMKGLCDFRDDSKMARNEAESNSFLGILETERQAAALLSGRDRRLKQTPHSFCCDHPPFVTPKESDSLGLNSDAVGEEPIDECELRNCFGPETGRSEFDALNGAETKFYADAILKARLLHAEGLAQEKESFDLFCFKQNVDILDMAIIYSNNLHSDALQSTEIGKVESFYNSFCAEVDSEVESFKRDIGRGNERSIKLKESLNSLLEEFVALSPPCDGLSKKKNSSSNEAGEAEVQTADQTGN